MSRANDLTPPIDSSVELLPIGFDFYKDLAAGETIVSVVSLTCAVYQGIDTNPSSRLIGSPFIIASAKTGAALSAVGQQVGSMLAGATYRLQCVVLTSQGNQPSLWTHFACVAPV